MATPIERKDTNPDAECNKRDLELNPTASAHLINDTVHNLSWKNVTVTVKDRRTRKPLAILSDSSGCIEAGQLLALMGPSGSGKTTLLNVLAQRIGKGVKIDGEVLVNGQKTPWSIFRHVSSYVEQEEALIGALTVKETLGFAAKLSLPRSVPHSPLPRHLHARPPTPQDP